MLMTVVYLSFHYWMIFFFLSDCCARNSDTVLNRSGGSGHPYLVSLLKCKGSKNLQEREIRLENKYVLRTKDQPLK